MKRILKVVSLTLAAASLVFSVTSCSQTALDNETSTLASSRSATEAQALLQEKVEANERTAFAAQINIDGIGGEKTGTWSQDGNGSWRFDYVSGGSSAASAAEQPGATIYNSGKAQGWVIRGDTAYEITDAEYLEVLRQSYSPIAMGDFFSAPPTEAFTVAGVDGVWAWGNYPGDEADTFALRTDGQNFIPEGEFWHRLEFRGPEGLLSKDSTGGSGDLMIEKTFEYSQIGDVPADTFDLPGDVKQVKSYEEYLQDIEPLLENSR